MDKTAIIGTGPAGTSAAIYLSRFAHNVLLFDKKISDGRTSMAPDLQNYLGHSDKLTGKEFINNIRQQIKRFPIEFIKEKVVEINQSKNGIFNIIIENNHKFQVKYLIVAVGLFDGYIKLPNIDKYYDKSIFHCLACDWWQNRNKKIVVAGNNEEAIFTAATIAKMEMPPKLSVVPTDENFSFDKELIKISKKLKIQIYQSPIREIIGKNDVVQKIVLENGQNVECQIIFETLGFIRRDKFLDKGNISPERNEKGFIVVNFDNYESSTTNLFAVGPCNDGPDQAIIAAGEGAVAALEIHSRIMTEKFEGLNS